MSNAKKLSRRLLAEARERERAAFAIKKPKRRSFGGADENGEDVPPREDDHESIDLLAFLQPTVEMQMTSPGSSLTGYGVMEELYHHRQRPFVEGEPIGAYAARKPHRVTELHPTGHYRQRDMLLLRHKNDLMIARILRG